MYPAFYVRIIRCSASTYWYRDYIGHVYPVVPTRHPGRYCVLGIHGFIDIDDCEVVYVEVTKKEGGA